MALAVELKQLTEQRGWNAPRIVEKVAADPAFINELAALALADRPEWAQLLLFVDQFEELFTLVNPRHIESFAALLMHIAASQRVRAVVTMRSDFYHRCIDHPTLAALLREGSFPLAAPDAFALLEMIERPAQRAALVFDESLAREIVHDTGSEPGALALMAYTLDELYQRCKSSGKLTESDYTALGGVQGAIGTRAEHIFSTLDTEAQNALPRVFRELVRIDEQGTATRHRARLSAIASGRATQKFVDALISARLLTASAVDGVALVDVAHEALFHSWVRLREWIQTAEEQLVLLEKVRDAAQEWEAQGRPDYLLWPHERLKPIYQLEAQAQFELTEPIRSFILPESARLLAEFKHSSWHRMHTIVDRFALIGASAVPMMVEALTIVVQMNNPDRFFGLSDYQDSIAKELIRLLQSYPVESIPFLIPHLSNRDTKIRQAVIKCLGNPESKNLVPELLHLLQEDSTDIRLATIETLTLIGDYRAVEPVIEFFPNGRHHEKQAALRMMGFYKDEASLLFLAKALQDESLDIRLRSIAANSLGKRREHDAVSVLVDHQEDNSG